MPEPMRTAFIRPVVLLLVSACAARAPSAGRVPLDRSVITQKELQEHRFETLFDGIQALRPTWLQTRGTNTLQAQSTQVQVYLDNVRMGGISTLNTINISSVVYVRHYDGIAATARWGLDHGQGVIYISTHPEGAVEP